VLLDHVLVWGTAQRGQRLSEVRALGVLPIWLLVENNQDVGVELVAVRDGPDDRAVCPGPLLDVVTDRRSQPVVVGDGGIDGLNAASSRSSLVWLRLT
jgi:hypothetical protein